MRLKVIRLFGDGAVETTDGFVVATETRERMSEIEQRARRARVDRERLPDQVCALGELAVLDLHRAEQLQGIELGRDALEDLAIDPLRLDQLAALMQRHRVAQARGDIRLLVRGLPRHRRFPAATRLTVALRPAGNMSRAVGSRIAAAGAEFPCRRGLIEPCGLT